MSDDMHPDEDVERLVQRLHGLLQDPHPGLMTWTAIRNENDDAAFEHIQQVRFPG